MRGATSLISLSLLRYSLFQSTLPMRGATIIKSFFRWLYEISIHAPHAGSDVFGNLQLLMPTIFQSTLPMRGATAVRYEDLLPMS